jgi:prepilin-type N-terminal cleavage/methylation domain-containing protein
MRQQGRAGLTLVELLVVLVILAILTTVAITATDSLVDQGRYDATTRTLQSVEEAILGSTNQHEPDGTLLVTGFVADVGRLPALIGTDPRMQLQELWSNPSGLASFGLYATSDPEVKIMCGWRTGGYLQLTTQSDGTKLLRDGWANPLALASAGTPATLSIVSGGANGKINAADTGFDTDVTKTIDGSRYTATITGTVTLLDAMGNARDTSPADTSAIGSASPPATPAPKVSVVLYGPDPTTGMALATPAIMTRLGTGIYSYLVTTTIGPRVIRAYETGDTPKKSRIASIAVMPSGKNQPLTIQP